MQATHYKWSEVHEDQLKGAIKRRFIYGESAMIAQFDIGAGEIVPEHAHHNEQLSYIVSGAMRFTLGGKDEIVVRSGEVLVIPANVPHSAVALEHCIAIDVFAPPREDWISGTDAYLREEAASPS
jgi:unsaturated pyranuronate lyase